MCQHIQEHTHRYAQYMCTVIYMCQHSYPRTNIHRYAQYMCTVAHKCQHSYTRTHTLHVHCGTCVPTPPHKNTHARAHTHTYLCAYTAQPEEPLPEFVPNCLLNTNCVQNLQDTSGTWDILVPPEMVTQDRKVLQSHSPMFIFSPPPPF